MSKSDIDQLAVKFGEEHRQMIAAALEFLEQEEPTWGLSEPINREEYILELLKNVCKKEKT